MTDHPMTENTPAEPLSREHERDHTDYHHDARPWQACTRKDICAGDMVERRSGTALGTGVAHRQDEDGDWLTKDGYLLTYGDYWTLRRIPSPTPEKDTTLTENTSAEPLAREHTDPFHDTRPWQDCTHKDIRKGDLVEMQCGDSLRIGVAHHQDEDGDWLTKDGYLLPYGDYWTLRRIPSPTPEKETAMTETTPAAMSNRQDRPAEVTDEMVEAGARAALEEVHVMDILDWDSLSAKRKRARRATARITLEAALAVHTRPSETLARILLGVPDTHGEPHHDVKEIKAEDFVLQVDKDGSIRGGRAHYLDRNGYWVAQNGKIVTWTSRRADHPEAVTVWPAPTPPAEEVELPTDHPAYITDVEGVDGDWCAYMGLSNSVFWAGVDQDGDVREWTPFSITAFTLPDGTRARRDGKHEDGTPRFVKALETCPKAEEETRND